MNATGGPEGHGKRTRSERRGREKALFEASLHLLDVGQNLLQLIVSLLGLKNLLMLGQLPLARSHHLSDAFIRELSLHEQRVP